MSDTAARAERQRVAVAETPETASRTRSLAADLTARGNEVSVVAPSALDVEVTPPYLSESYALYCALRNGGFAAIVFPDAGGLAYCAARARQAGTDFGSTAIVVECRAPTLRAFRETGAPFLSKRLLGTIASERLALELADAVVCEDPRVLDWFEHEGWALPEQRLQSVSDIRPLPARAEVEGSQPLVSVVVPYHERTAYLPHCLEGLARQTYPALEVLIADDGSVSGSALRQLRDLEARSWPWPFRVLHLPHGGLGAARNGGWRAASADLVLFIDEDDVAFDGLVEGLWRARRSAAADIAVAGARFFRGQGPPSAGPGDVIRISLCDPGELGLISNQYGGPVNLWPRTTLEQLGGFALVPNEDWDLLARAAMAGARVTTSPEPLYWYRQTPGSMYSADPAAFRDAGVPAISARFAEQLPAGMKLVPQLAAGAYSELERRRRDDRSRLGALDDRARLLRRRVQAAWRQEGAAGVLRGAFRLARRHS
ncbi:MAG TPA: glycosyltransferase family 2 protein [Gaiellaceae bacterium]